MTNSRTDLDSQERARINNFICKSTMQGGIQCRHKKLSLAVSADVESASIYSRENGLDISVNHEPEDSRLDNLRDS